MRKFLLFCLFTSCVATQNVWSQQPGKITQVLLSLADTSQTHKIYKRLANNGEIPLIENDSVLFLYYGNAKTVAWMGDFNGWGRDVKYQTSGIRITGTNLWYWKTSFPPNARLDYKIVVNSTNWILDPVNKNQQWSGVGGGSPNSEIRMPGYKPDAEEWVSTTKTGTVLHDILLNSESLEYQITYSVYLPYQYSSSVKYPVLYVTDGYEYMHEHMGNMQRVLDFLIEQKKIKPIVVVFVDHREPVNRGNNKRMQELAMNEKYFRFFTDELIPVVEKSYSVSDNAAERGILGTSMGGLTAAYFAFSKPSVFGLCGIQSPAFWFKPEIYTLCDNQENPPVKIMMTTGNINDTKEGTDKMKAILEKNTCTYQLKEVPEGHSWGNWRNLLDDILVYFFSVNP
ncbi:MAG: alpha/beta hydrolase-fold protein [Cyclobacteriaceae bacterium]|jgi:enterochelin esterase family protein|nr:alpha/beta hydrolase-fold protein [Cyclobacteriaceae bacterium]